MGCQSSNADKPLSIRINILDSNFMKQKNNKVRQKMNKLNIKYEVYLSLYCLIQNMSNTYVNEIVTPLQRLSQLKKQLKKLNFHPNIYVLSQKQTGLQQKNFNKNNQNKIYKNYESIIMQLSSRTFKKQRVSINAVPQSYKQQIFLKILRKTQKQSSQQLIFQQTLKSKNISYEIYKSFAQFSQSNYVKGCDFVVTDYVYHRQVLNVIQDTTTKVICLNQSNKDQVYDSRIYFVTSNFLQIVSQISSEKMLSHLNLVKCSKVYIYANQQNYITEFAPLIQNFGVQVKIYSDLSKIMYQSKYFFAVTILLNPEQRKEVQKYLQKNDYMFKTKFIEIKKGTQNSVNGLRKVLKEIKKGYRAQKGMAKGIDIIDKHFNNVKFDSIKKQLEKYEIKSYGYNNLNDYIKKKKFISSFIICNYQQRTLITRYLKEIRSKTNVILFCNKNNITQQLKQNKNFAFVSSHFGKILNFIKKKSVYNPYIVDQHDCRLIQKKQKLKRHNKRVSALAWCGETKSIFVEQSDPICSEKYKDFQFFNVSQKINQLQLNEMKRQSASFFKLDYSPLENKGQFKKDLIQSLQQIQLSMKINYPQGQFQKILSQIQKMNTEQLINKVRDFFSSKNEMGIKINKTLINILKLSKEQIQSLKQLLFYINLNFLSVYRDKFFGKIKLQHYLSNNLISKCQVGSILMNKNYSIFYQKDLNSRESDNVTPYKIQIQFEINSLADKNPQFNSYFRNNDKFIFSPYSQFIIKKISKEQKVNIITVQYKKDIQFLKCYFTDNLLKQRTNIIRIYEQQLQKSKTSFQESFFFDQLNKQTFYKNIIKTKALISFRNNQLQEAIKLQKQVIIREQNLQNFDSEKLQWLNYELACFYFKLQKHVQCKNLLQQILQAQPNQNLKDKIISLYRFYKVKQQKKSQKKLQNQQQCDQAFKNIVLEQSIANYNSIQSPQLDKKVKSIESQEGDILQTEDFLQQISCLEIDKIQNFEIDCKQNIY